MKHLSLGSDMNRETESALIGKWRIEMELWDTVYLDLLSALISGSIARAVVNSFLGSLVA